MATALDEARQRVGKNSAAANARPSNPAHAERNRRVGEQRRERMRLRLIEAAMRVISERGMETLVIDDFIVAAGIARGSFYNHFNTKDELIDAVADHLRLQMFRTDDVRVAHLPDAAERLSWVTRTLVRRAGSEPHLGLLLIIEARRITPFEVVLRRHAARDIELSIAQGRVPRQDVDGAVDFVVGATREAARAAIGAVRSKDHAEETALRLLMGLGMSATEAREVVARPLVDFIEQDGIGP